MKIAFLTCLPADDLAEEIASLFGLAAEPTVVEHDGLEWQAAVVDTTPERADEIAAALTDEGWVALSEVH